MSRKIVRRNQGAPTISDVARLAGVSPMTVSRVINRETGVRDGTREAVREAIATLNYAPNRAAQALAGADQVRIGLLYSNPSSAYLSEFLVGGLDQASRGNVQLVVERVREDQSPEEAVQHLLDGGIDGVLLPPPLCDSEGARALLAQVGLPAVVVATGRAPAGMLAVRIDDRLAAKAMTLHIAALGHRRIGFIVGNPNQSASAERLRGYHDGLAEAGLQRDDDLVVQGAFTYRSGLEASGHLLGLAEPPTAIFASNDDMAAATVAVAHRRRLDVPGDLSVCGFDDTALATTIWPELTTIRQPITDMSRAAVNLLVQLIRDRRAGRVAPPQHMMLDFTLVRRQSDAEPIRREPSSATA